MAKLTGLHCKQCTLYNTVLSFNNRSRIVSVSTLLYELICINGLCFCVFVFLAASKQKL